MEKNLQVRICKKGMLHILSRVGMGEKVVSVNYTKKFGNVDWVTIHDIIKQYKMSQSKYKKPLMDIVLNDFGVDYTKVRIPKQMSSSDTIDMMFGYSDLEIFDSDTEEEALRKTLIYEKKSVKQIEAFVKRAMVGGEIKESSKYYNITEFVREQTKNKGGS